MRKLALLCLAAVTITALSGVALASHGDPNGHIAAAQAFLTQAQAELDAAKLDALAPVTVTVTTTETVTVTVTQTPTTTVPPPTTTTAPVPTTTTTVPPAPGFPTRQEALARPDVVVLSGTRSTQYKPPASTDVTYDLRGLTSTAYPFGSSFPVVLNGTRAISIGATVLGQQPRDAMWATVHDTYGGKALSMTITDYGASYDLRADNVNDGFGPLPASGLTGTFLIEGAYMTWIRDDAVEDDIEMSGTIRDILVDGVNDAISIGQSTKNPNAVVDVENVVFIHAPMPNARAADGIGHQTLFKQLPGGKVNLTNVTDCMYENPITPSRIQIRPAGTWTNVTFVLGPGWVGPDPAVSAGASVSRDWQGKCLDARDAWLAVHHR